MLSCVFFIVRKFRYQKLKHFCFTREDFNKEYGLSLEGKLHQNLSLEDLPDKEWLSVFSRKRDKGMKLFLHMLQPGFVDECRLLYHKVYQAPPMNNEIMLKFATLFAYEKCTAAKKDPAGHKVAWAVFGEQVVEHCKRLPGGIEKKVNKWMEDNKTDAGPSICSQVNAPEQKPIKKEVDTAHSSLVLASKSIIIGIQVAAAEEMASRRLSKIEEIKNVLVSKRAELEQRRESMWKSEGASSAAALLYAQLEKLKAKHVKLKETSSASQEDIKNDVVRMSALEDALDVLGVDKSMSSAKSELELLEVCTL